MDGERLDIAKTLAYLDADEKLRMLSGDGMWHTFGAGELPRVRMSEFIAQNRFQQILVLRAVFAVKLVICAHDRRGLGFEHSRNDRQYLLRAVRRFRFGRARQA